MPLFGYIFQKSNISYHFYADDSQFYLSVRPDTKCPFEILLKQLEDITSWIVNNFLCLSEGITEVLFLGCPMSSRSRKLI